MENPDKSVNGVLMKHRMELVKLCNQLECENKLLKSKLSEKRYVPTNFFDNVQKTVLD